MDMMGISHTQNLCWINMTGQKRLNVCTPILEEYEWANLLLYTGIMGLIYKKLKGGSAVENGYEARDLKTKVGQRSGMQVILWILGAWVWPRAVMSWKLAATCLDGGLAVCSLMETQARLFIDGNPSQPVRWWKPKPDCSLVETQARLFIDGNPSQTRKWKLKETEKWTEAGMAARPSGCWCCETDLIWLGLHAESPQKAIYSEWDCLAWKQNCYKDCAFSRSLLDWSCHRWVFRMYWIQRLLYLAWIRLWWNVA